MIWKWKKNERIRLPRSKNVIAAGIQAGEFHWQACQLTPVAMIQPSSFPVPQWVCSGFKVPESESNLSTICSYTQALARGRTDYFPKMQTIVKNKFPQKNLAYYDKKRRRL